jgi:hypothetical protein
LWFVGCLYKDASVITFAVAGLLYLVTGEASRKLASQGLWRHHEGIGENAITIQPSLNTALRPNRQLRTLWLTMPALISAALAQGLFNLIRYRSVLPEAYLNEVRLTATPLLFRLQSLYWSLASPNGGLIVFWGLCFAVLIIYALSQMPHDQNQFAAVKMAAIWATVTLIGLSFWWNPFGWESWGDRLMVPAMMALVICCWDALSHPWWGQALLSPADSSEPGVPSPAPAPARQRKAWPKPVQLASCGLVSLLVFISLPYVSLGYQANGTDLRDHPAPQLIHCAKMMALLNAIPPEKHLEFVYSGETWRQCALESYRYNPALAR